MSRRHQSIFILLAIVAASTVGATRSSAQGQVYDYATGARATRLWVPPGVNTIRGILIYGNGSGGDSRDEVYTPWNEVFAYENNFAVIGTSMWDNLSGTEINIWDSHLANLAALSGHPELVNAPWAPIGFSNGGQMSYGFNALRPEKTIAFITNKGGFYNVSAPSTAALRTPGVLIAGELDTSQRRTAIKGLFDTNRPRGALWSWVEQQGEMHTGRADAMMLPLMAEAIRKRYPAAPRRPPRPASRCSTFRSPAAGSLISPRGKVGSRKSRPTTATPARNEKPAGCSTRMLPSSTAPSRRTIATPVSISTSISASPLCWKPGSALRKNRSRSSSTSRQRPIGRTCSSTTTPSRSSISRPPRRPAISKC